MNSSFNSTDFLDSASETKSINIVGLASLIVFYAAVLAIGIWYLNLIEIY